MNSELKNKLEKLLKGMESEKANLETEKADMLSKRIDILSISKLNKITEEINELDSSIKELKEDLKNYNAAIGKVSKLNAEYKKLLSDFEGKTFTAEMYENLRKVEEKIAELKYEIRETELDLLDKYCLQLEELIEKEKREKELLEEAKKVNKELVVKAEDILKNNKDLTNEEKDELTKAVKEAKKVAKSDDLDAIIKANSELQDVIFKITLEKTHVEVEVLSSEKEELTNEQKKARRKKAFYTILALAAAAGLAVSLNSCGNSKGNKNNNSNPIVTEQPTSEPIEEKEELTEEVIAQKAYDIYNDLNTHAPGHDYTQAEIENIIRWINGGIPEEVSPEAALFAITRIENLMNKENQEEVAKAFHMGAFMLKGTQGEKLARDIYGCKNQLMATKGTEQFEEEAKIFTELLVNSVTLGGTNNEISAYALETSGMKALIDTYFVNTAAYIPNDVTVVVNGSEFKLSEAIKAMEEANCKVEVMDNGETVEVMTNKFSADLLGMINEATYAKENTAIKTLKVQ